MTECSRRAQNESHTEELCVRIESVTPLGYLGHRPCFGVDQIVAYYSIPQWMDNFLVELKVWKNRENFSSPNFYWYLKGGKLLGHSYDFRQMI